MPPNYTTAEAETQTTEYVLSGQIVTGSKDRILTSTPLGSCVAVVAYDAKNKMGGMAHIMLPEKSKIEICLAGGANVLQKQNDTIAKENVNSVINTIRKMNLTLCASSLGGYERRSISINIQTGMVCCTIGNGPIQPLWKFGTRHLKRKTHSNISSEKIEIEN